MAGPPADRTRVAGLLPLGLVALAGTVAMLVVVRRGPYLSADALAYVGTARNLVDGHGLTTPPGAPPMGNFPPLYPLVLAAAALTGPDPLTVARYLGPLLLGCTVLVAGFLSRRLTGSLGTAVAVQLLVVSGLDALAYHSSALSEPLFLLVSLLALATLATWLERPRPRPALLVAAALLAGAACLTRYLGLAVVVAGVAGLVTTSGRRRRREALLFAAVAVLPLAGWLAWVGAAEGRVTNRAAVLHLPDAGYVTGGLRWASTWVLPIGVPWPVRAVAAAGAVVALAALAARARTGPAADGPGNGYPPTARLLGLFAAAYLAALVVDRALFDVTGRLDARFLLPVHVTAVMLAATVFARPPPRPARAGLVAVVAVQVAAGALWVGQAATDPAVRPGGFGAPAWQRSEVVDQVRSLPPGAAVFTNQVDALWFHTGRVARPLPERAAFLTGRANPAYAGELDAVRRSLGAGGVVVYFTAVPARRAFLDPPERLAAALDLRPVLADAAGTLYRPDG